MTSSVVVVGGGPAGMVLGLLLARAGITVTVLEKHTDSLRDFRGDTVRPSTMTLLDDLGLFNEFDALPQNRLEGMDLTQPVGTVVRAVDFSRLPVPAPGTCRLPYWVTRLSTPSCAPPESRRSARASGTYCPKAPRWSSSPRWMRSSTSMFAWTGSPGGTAPSCCALAMPPTPCPRSAGWASTWRFKMRWPRRDCWHLPCARAR